MHICIKKNLQRGAERLYNDVFTEIAFVIISIMILHQRFMGPPPAEIKYMNHSI